MEIAPGIDLQKDILDQMDFLPLIPENLKTMDASIFMEDQNGYDTIGPDRGWNDR